jgi:hypothetical protein
MAVSQSRKRAERRGATVRCSVLAGRLAQACPSLEQKGEACWASLRRSGGWSATRMLVGILARLESSGWGVGGARGFLEVVDRVGEILGVGESLAEGWVVVRFVPAGAFEEITSLGAPWVGLSLSAVADTSVSAAD